MSIVAIEQMSAAAVKSYCQENQIEPHANQAVLRERALSHVKVLMLKRKLDSALRANTQLARVKVEAEQAVAPEDNLAQRVIDVVNGIDDAQVREIVQQRMSRERVAHLPPVVRPQQSPAKRQRINTARIFVEGFVYIL